MTIKTVQASLVLCTFWFTPLKFYLPSSSKASFLFIDLSNMTVKIIKTLKGLRNLHQKKEKEATKGKHKEESSAYHP